MSQEIQSRHEAVESIKSGLQGGNLSVAYQEVEKYLRHTPKEQRAAETAGLLNALDKENILPKLIVEAGKTLLKEADRNHDGRLTLDELTAAKIKPAIGGSQHTTMEDAVMNELTSRYQRLSDRHVAFSRGGGGKTTYQGITEKNLNEYQQTKGTEYSHEITAAEKLAPYLDSLQQNWNKYAGKNGTIDHAAILAAEKNLSEKIKVLNPVVSELKQQGVSADGTQKAVDDYKKLLDGFQILDEQYTNVTKSGREGKPISVDSLVTLKERLDFESHKNDAPVPIAGVKQTQSDAPYDKSPAAGNEKAAEKPAIADTAQAYGKIVEALDGKNSDINSVIKDVNDFLVRKYQDADREAAAQKLVDAVHDAGRGPALEAAYLRQNGVQMDYNFDGKTSRSEVESTLTKLGGAQGAFPMDDALLKDVLKDFSQMTTRERHASGRSSITTEGGISESSLANYVNQQAEARKQSLFDDYAKTVESERAKAIEESLKPKQVILPAAELLEGAPARLPSITEEPAAGDGSRKQPQLPLAEIVDDIPPAPPKTALGEQEASRPSRPAAEHLEQLTEQPTEQPTEKPTEKRPELPIETIIEKAAEKPVAAAKELTEDEKREQAEVRDAIARNIQKYYREIDGRRVYFNPESAKDRQEAAEIEGRSSYHQPRC